MDVGRFVTSAREAKTGSQPLTGVSMVCHVRNHCCNERARRRRKRTTHVGRSRQVTGVFKCSSGQRNHAANVQSVGRGQMKRQRMNSIQQVA